MVNRILMTLLASLTLTACSDSANRSPSIADMTRVDSPPFEAVTVDGKTTATCKPGGTQRCYVLAVTSECTQSSGIRGLPKLSCNHQVFDQFILAAGETKTFAVPASAHYKYCVGTAGFSELYSCATNPGPTRL